MQKVLPSPSVLSHVIVPDRRATIASTMESPRPLPVAELGVRAEDTV